MREASESRLPRAKEAKSLKLGEPECWPIAAVIHLCVSSHTCHRSFTPFLESCLRVTNISRYGGKSIHAYCGVRTSYFSSHKSAIKVKNGERILLLRRILYLYSSFKGLTGVWTKKSKFLLADKQSSPFLAAGTQVHSSAQASARYYNSPPSLSACIILSFPVSLVFGFRISHSSNIDARKHN